MRTPFIVYIDFIYNACYVTLHHYYVIYPEELFRFLYKNLVVTDNKKY